MNRGIRLAGDPRTDGSRRVNQRTRASTTACGTVSFVNRNEKVKASPSALPRRFRPVHNNHRGQICPRSQSLRADPPPRPIRARWRVCAPRTLHRQCRCCREPTGRTVDPKPRRGIGSTWCSKKYFSAPDNVTEIGGGSEKIAVSSEDVGHRRRQRRHHLHLDALDLGIASPGRTASNNSWVVG